MKKALYFVLTLSILVFASCKNFMNAGNVQKEIEDMIKEANAKVVKLVISQDTTMGTFLSSGEKECKLGYSIDVQFNLKKDAYIFKGLKAVSTNDEETPRDDCIEFAIKDRDDDKGIYKIEIKVVKEASDIMIVPDCIMVPGVVKEDCLPVYSDAGCEQDTTIVIAFNKPVSATDNFTLSITDVSGNSLYDFFNEPYFSSDGTILYIPTNKDKNLLDPQDSINNRDIFVKFDLSNIVDEEGNIGNNVFQYKYRVNKQKDSVKPVLNDVRVYSTNNTNSEYYKQILSSNSEMWTAGGPESNDSGDYGKNHVGGSIYLELEGTDIGAGIGSVLVKEKLLMTTNGTPQTGSAVAYHSPILTNKDTGLISGTYTFNTPSDGVLEIEIFAEDYSNNTSTASKKFWVLKDTKIDSFNISFLEELEDAPEANNMNELNSWIASMNNKTPIINGNTQTVSLTLNETQNDMSGKFNSKDYFYQIFYDDYKVSVYWGESENAIQNPVYKNSQGQYVFTRDVTKYVFIKLICEDGIGNVKTIIKRMAPRAEMTPGEGYYDIANFYALLNKSLISFPDPSLGSSPEKYCNYVYEFTSSDTNNPLTFTEVRPGESGISPYNIRMVFDHIKALKLEEDPSITDDDIYKAGTLNIRISTTVGDFPSPASSNYLSTTITGWATTTNPDPSDDTQTITVHNPNYGELKLSSTSTNQATNIEYNKYGPTGKNYIPSGTPLKISVTPIKSQGSCKINVENYKTQAGEADGIIYTIHAIAIIQKDTGVYDYSAQFTTSSTTSELILTANLIYRFFIEAYDPVSKTSYIPLPYIDTQTGEVNVLLHGFELLIENIGDTQEEEEQKDPGELGYHIIPDDPTNDPTQPTDELVLRKDVMPPLILVGKKVITENPENPSDFYTSLDLEEDNDLINDFGNAASLYIQIHDSETDYTGGVSNQGQDPFESFKKNKYGKVELSYYIIPNPSDNIKKVPSYTVSELQTVYSSYEKKIEISDTWVNIPFGNVEGGSYTISFIAEDKYNNTAVYTYPFINNTLGHQFFYEINPDNPKNKYNNNHASEGIEYKYYDLELTDANYLGWLTAEPLCLSFEMDKLSTLQQNAPSDTNRNWINTTYTPFSDDPVLNDEGITVTDSEGYPVHIRHTTIRCDNVNQWRRIRVYEGFTNNLSTYGKGFYYYDYIFVGENPRCFTKNCMDGLNGVQVWSDNSVLIHTMYSNEKLTESRYVEDAASIWETRGLETGLVAFNYSQATDGAALNKTYELKHLNEIPSGFYYTTIIHYADGTVIMTDIKQKQ